MADTRFLTYLKSFFTDALTAMSGPLSVPFAAVALWVSGSGQKFVFGCLAVVSAGFASYRVWRCERLTANSQLASKDAEITALAAAKDAQIAALNQALAIFKSKIDVLLKTDGTPPSQFINVITNTNDSFQVVRVEYMTSKEVTIASKDVSIKGVAVKIPIDNDLLTQLWNTPRDDQNPYDHSGPGKIALALSIKGKSLHLVLPVHMQDYYGNTSSGGTIVYRQITGSKTFIGQ